MLKNPRHERFAQLVARGKPQVQAYGLAGYRRTRQSAHRLLTNADVRRRISAIRKEHERMSKRTKEQHFAKWLEREDKVEKQGKDALAHKISYDYALAMGWITTKQEVTNKQDNAKENAVRLARLSPDERLVWERLCAKIADDLTEEELAEVA